MSADADWLLRQSAEMANFLDENVITDSVDADQLLSGAGLNNSRIKNRASCLPVFQIGKLDLL